MRKKIIFLLFLMLFIPMSGDFLFAVQYEPIEKKQESSTTNTSEPPAWEPVNAFTQQPEQEYKPFNTGNGDNLESPVLYGPSGPPVGGLPVTDSWWVLFFFIGLYALYKCIFHLRYKSILSFFFNDSE